jgi:glycosyltransferase involved in cell wall biosynthesis
MIVKNETQLIERCLNSIKPIIDYWVIVDTGSTDGTQDLIRQCMKDIPGELYERPWKNFGHNRNEALDLAKGKGDYILMMDADDYLELAPGFSLGELTQDGYMFKIQVRNAMTFYRIQLINASRPWKWLGVLHEALTMDGKFQTSVLEKVIYRDTREGARSQDPEKYKKDAKVLEEALKEEPNNSRYVFYLAQSYRDAKMPEKSIEWYAKRIALGGWPEEVYISMLNIAFQNRKMNKPIESIIGDFYKAFTYRPFRPEALYHLAAIYIEQNRFDLAYSLLKSRMFIKRPQKSDILFVETWMEEFGLLFELSVASYGVGEFMESLQMTDQLLALPSLPDEIRKAVEQNRQRIINQLTQSEKAG